MRTLVFEANFAGDSILSSPIFRAVRDNTGSRADWLGWSSSMPAIQANPYVGGIISFEGYPLRLFASLRGKYDLIINLTTSLKWSLATSLIGRTVGYDYLGTGLFHAYPVKIHHRTFHGGYRADEVCDLVERALGWKVENRSLCLRVEPYLRERWGRSMFGRKIGIHTTVANRQNEREWSIWKWAHLCQTIQLNDPEAVLFLTGQDSAAPWSKFIHENSNYPDRVIDLTGRTGFMDLCAVISNLDLLITVNTAPMHIAVALGVPVLAIVGGTPARVVLPKSEKVRFVEDPGLSDKRYKPRLDEITVDQVYQLYREMV